MAEINNDLSGSQTYDLNAAIYQNATQEVQKAEVGMTGSDSTATLLFLTDPSTANALKPRSANANHAYLEQPVTDVFGENYDQTADYQAAHDVALSDVIKQLPQDLQIKIAQQMALDPADRDPQIVALMVTLNNIATIVVGESAIKVAADVAAGTVPTPPATGTNDSAAKGAIGSAADALKNVQTYLQSTIAASGGDNATVAFLSAIQTALGNAMQLLSQMGIDDSKNDKVLAQAKMDAAKAQMENTLKQIQNMLDQLAAQAHMSLIMRICMPIISAVIAAVGVAIAVASMGAAAAPAAVAVAVAIAAISTSLSVADSATNGKVLTQPMQTAFKDLRDALPGDPLEKDLLEIAIILAVVAIITVISPGAAADVDEEVAGSVAGAEASVALEAVEGGAEDGAEAGVEAGTSASINSSAEEVDEVSLTRFQQIVAGLTSVAGKALIRDAIESLALEFGITALTASNVIVDFTTDLLNKMLDMLGRSRNDQLVMWLAQAMQIIVMITIMLTVLLSKGKGASAAAKSMSASEKTMAVLGGIQTTGKVLQVGAELTQAGLGGYQAYVHFQLACQKQDLKGIEQAIAMLAAVLQDFDVDLKNLQDATSQSFKAVNSINDLFNSIIQNLSNIVNSASSAVQG